VTLQALAAVLGGTQSLHTNSLDETYALPTKEAVTLALRTQQVIAHESGVADTIDPLAGSYYLEHLTDRMEDGFARYLAEIEKRGGMVEAVEQGYPQREIVESAFHFQQQVEEGEKTIVGINKYATDEEVPIPTLAIDPDVERKQNERLAETRRTRDKERWRSSLEELRHWSDEVRQADAVIVGSYVPEGVEVGRFVQRLARGVTAFYDIDTPVTLAKLDRRDFEYLSPQVIPGYDVYLSFTGGPTLRRIEREYGSPAARALYCSVDPDAYPPLDVPKRWDLSYLGTYSADRQPTLERLLIEPARRMSDRRFVVAGPQYPADIHWPANVQRIDHLPPAEHPAFYAASRYTLNVTRADMIAAGWSPSVRLFEAAACAVPVVSDVWEGLDSLFTPDEEIVLARTTEEVVALLSSDADAGAMGRRARARVMHGHRAADRAADLEAHLAEAIEARAEPLAVAAL